MNNLIGASLGALEIAGSLCGVPYVGAAAIILQDVARCCGQVAVHKRKADRLANKCAQLLTTLQDQTTRLDGSELLQAVDEVVAVLDRIHKRVKQWSRYNRVKSFLMNADIEKGLDQCESELDTAMNLFQVNAHILVSQLQREAIDVHRSNSAEMRELLHQILTSQNDLRRVVEMQGSGEHVAESIMEAGQRELRHLRETANPDDLIISGTLSSSPPPEPRDSQRYLQYQRGLIALHRNTGIPPSVKILNGEVTKIGDLAIAGGTYSDIWLGKWLESEKVALKALRNIKASNPRAQQRFEREINVWADLKNDHILPFYGIVTDLGQHIQMVSPWQEHGNVLEHVKSHPKVNRIHLLSGAAKGIEYLHSRGVIHGNVKCANILISASGEACICDFGMSKVIEEVTEKSASATLTASGSARWLAPELIEGSISSPTMPADTYSYAMAILELLTGKHPYSHRKRDASVIHDIVVLKKTPPRPKEGDAQTWLTDDLWVLMQDCWRPAAEDRPTMTRVASRIKEIEHGSSFVTATQAMDIS